MRLIITLLALARVWAQTPPPTHSPTPAPTRNPTKHPTPAPTPAPTLGEDDDYAIDDGSAFQPADRAALATAVDAWCSNQASALATYGDISGWDTSSVTTM